MVGRIANRRTNNSKCVIRQFSVEERILTVSLFEEVVVIDGLGSDEAKIIIVQDGDVSFGLIKVAILVIAHNSNGGLGLMGLVITM